MPTVCETILLVTFHKPAAQPGPQWGKVGEDLPASPDPSQSADREATPGVGDDRLNVRQQERHETAITTKYEKRYTRVEMMR